VSVYFLSVFDKEPSFALVKDISVPHHLNPYNAVSTVDADLLAGDVIPRFGCQQ
jgi:hypothetical protein